MTHAMPSLTQRFREFVRDWFTPIATLGGVLTLITSQDPTGQALRWIVAGLWLLTAVCCCAHLYYKNKPSKENPVKDLHIILFVLTLFFTAALAIPHTPRHGTAVEPKTTTQAPVPVDPVAAPLATVAPQPTTEVASAPEAATPATTASTHPLRSVDKIHTHGATASPVNKTITSTSIQTTTSAAHSDSTPEPTRGDRNRCYRLIDELSLGGQLSAADKAFMETACK